MKRRLARTNTLTVQSTWAGESVPGPLMPNSAMRSPTAVLSHSEIRVRVLEAQLGPGAAWQWHAQLGTVHELSISKIAARMNDPADAHVPLQIEVNGTRWFEAPLGLVHDAYDGRGLVGSSGRSTEEIVGEFGKILAKIDAVLEAMHIGKALSYTTPTEKVEALGASMNLFSETLAQLGRTTTSGLTLKAPILVAAHRETLEVRAASSLQGTVRVYLYCIEKISRP